VSDAYDRVREVGRKVSNWARWGSDDEVGTLNLITAEARARGASAVSTGRSFTLGLDIGPRGPQPMESPIGRFNPLHYMIAIGASWGEPPVFHYSDDVLVLPTQSGTQWDSLAHVHYDGLLYNGFPADEMLTSAGAARNGSDKQARSAVVTRGILLDIARLKGVERLDPGALITPHDLDAACEAAQVTVEPGDILLIRTGHITRFTVDQDRDVFNWQTPGVGLDSVPWFRERDVAAVATDTPNFEVLPGEDPAVISPVHLAAIRDMGMPLGEIFDLEALASACADDGSSEFLFTAQPLPITGGIGSPVNPVAVK
jgi:kynurenine formamidase